MPSLRRISPSWERPDSSHSVLASHVVKNSLKYPLRISHLAFPHDEDLPSQCAQCGFRAPVTCHICGKFCTPEVLPRFRGIGKAAALVSVPEASSELNNRAMAWHDDIRSPRQRTHVQAKPQSRFVKQRAQLQLGLGITPADPGHDFGTLRLGEDIRHSSLFKSKSEFPRPFGDSGSLDGLLVARLSSLCGNLPQTERKAPLPWFEEPMLL